MKKFFLLIFVGCIPLIYSLQCYETTTDTDENTVDEKGELTTCDPGIKYCVKVVGGQTRRTCDWGACYNESCGKLKYADSPWETEHIKRIKQYQ
uniref:Uncharacterized protein n=1 Tax=Acrobeloides nanus TaxID=290746 RepID=A0A914CND5_9BILA